MIKISYELIYTGYCTHPEWVTIQGGKWKSVRFPALCALLKHPALGNIIFDAGYSPRFFYAAKKFPLNIYPRFTPVFLEKGEDLSSQLQQRNIELAQVNKVILSHFHADHMCALSDFANAEYICSREGYNAICDIGGFAALRKGFLPDLLPRDFADRAHYIEDDKTQDISSYLAPFSTATDIFGDGSILAISLPGHAKAQFGIFFYDEKEVPTFFIADSCWSSKAYRKYLLPSIFAYFIMDNKKEYKETLWKLHKLHQQFPKVKLIPSHCEEIRDVVKNNIPNLRSL